MLSAVKRGYQQPRQEMVRVVVQMPKPEADAIDAWGIPIGMPNRTAAVRELLRKGLETCGISEAAGSASQA